MKKVLSKTFWADRDIEQLIGELLRYGVVTASVIVLFGGIIYLCSQGHLQMPAHHHFTGEAPAYTSLKGIINASIHFDTRAIIQTGVLVLIATPILRIAFSLVAFMVEKDRLYIIITFIVLGVMMFSMLGGLKV